LLCSTGKKRSEKMPSLKDRKCMRSKLKPKEL